jgi:valyl-tRNA synthetase
MEELQRLVTEIRRFRGEQGIKAGTRLPARIKGIEATAVAGYEAEVRLLTRLDQPGDDFTPGANLAVAGVTVEVDLSGGIDRVAEQRRLERELEATVKELEQAGAKLDNDQFRSRAPVEVVERMQARKARAEQEIARLQRQIEALSG